MSKLFEIQVRAAAIAGWWTLLIGVVFLTLQWILFLVLTSSKPAWILSLWGGSFEWETVRSLWLLGTAVLKLCLLLFALIVVWLTLWARQLRNKLADL
jgi:hypothetical protein